MSICLNKKNSNIIIVTHVFASGPAQELEEYLQSKAGTLVFIGHPFSYAKDIRSFCKVYRGAELICEKTARSWKLPELLMYLKDTYYTFFWAIKACNCFDVFIGADPLNAFAGSILKKIGKVKKSVFYTVDYIPKRFSNKLLNWIYHRIDRFCVNQSDYVWNLSERMINARYESGIKKTDNQIVVPIGVRFDRIKRLDIDKINRTHLVYMGHLRARQGLELIIDSLPEIIKKIPRVKLIIIGMGELEKFLKNRINELQLTNHVEFKGYIDNHTDVENILAKCAVGLALYEPHPDNFTYYTDPSKPKQYLACGLPVIITNVPAIANDVGKYPLGIVTEYNKEAVLNAVLKLFSEDKLYTQCRQNAIAFAANIDWNKIYTDAFHESNLLQE